MTTFCSPKTTFFLSVLLVGACTGEEKSTDTAEVQDSGVSGAETGEDTAETPQDTAETPQDTAENSEDTGMEEAIPQEYCANNDPTLADCDPDINYDPWIDGTGEVHYWICEQKHWSFHSPQMMHPRYGMDTCNSLLQKSHVTRAKTSFTDGFLKHQTAQ